MDPNDNTNEGQACAPGPGYPPLMNPDIENRFTYHAPMPGQPEKYTEIRERAKSLAYLLNAECPASRELSLALTKLEEAVFWANAAIARH